VPAEGVCHCELIAVEVFQEDEIAVEVLAAAGGAEAGCESVVAGAETGSESVPAAVAFGNVVVRMGVSGS